MIIHSLGTLTVRRIPFPAAEFLWKPLTASDRKVAYSYQRTTLSVDRRPNQIFYLFLNHKNPLHVN